MQRSLRYRLTVGALAAAGLVFTGAALARESHADGSSTTQPAACKLALTLARQGVAADQVTASHCECLENKDDPRAPWSCTAFVSYR
jgi:hypothetical protein